MFEVRKFCIDNNLFTCGTIKQYDKMFDALTCHDFSNRDIAIMIWTCSDNTTITLNEIENFLNKIREV